MTINEAVALASALIGIAAYICLYGHLSSVMNARFDSVDRRFDSVDRKFESVERRLEMIQSDTHISYHQGFFEAAPIDALAQRMGRVNRRAEYPAAPITVASRPLNPHVLYDSDRTRLTLDILRQFSAPISEQDLIGVCDQVYGNGYEGDDLLEFEAKRDHKYFTQFETSMVAGDHENWTERVIDVSNRVDVLPVSLERDHNQLSKERRWLEADALTVNIPLSQKLEQYVERGSDPWTIDLPYTADGLELP